MEREDFPVGPGTSDSDSETAEGIRSEDDNDAGEAGETESSDDPEDQPGSESDAAGTEEEEERDVGGFVKFNPECCGSLSCNSDIEEAWQAAGE